MASNIRRRRLMQNLALGSISLLVACITGCAGDLNDTQPGTSTTPDNTAPGSGGGSSTDGNTTDDGKGGNGEDGSGEGGRTDGGTNATGNGGATDSSKGGTSQSGLSKGGSNAGGSTSTNTEANGGSNTGGSTSTSTVGNGGANQGGSATGGKAQGGSAAGGAATGGKAQGGSATGGAATGGKAQGGSATGGAATGGAGTTNTAVAAEYVAATNAVRAAVTKPANYSGTWEPLPNVTWSEEVAASAQAWVNKLRDTQNCSLAHEQNTGLGENLAGGWGLNPKAAVDMWESEKGDYTYSPRYSFDTGAGHYTQLVWRNSIEIGCASASCGDNSVISCRYKPPGNVDGQQIY